MTGGAAAALGLADRGLLAEGQAADVVLFDPATIIDRSTYDDPHQYPAGIGTVIVNGTVVIEVVSTPALCRAGCSGGGERC